MASESVEAFRASLGRCLATPDFMHDFYERFIASSAEVRDKFKDTEFARQARVVTDSLYIMAVVAESKEDAIGWRELDRLAARHARTDLDVRPALYDDWLECLLAAARQHDPEFSNGIEDAWRKTLAPGIEYMRSRHSA
jgi:hemoglobin-like flavoprotein